MFSAWVPPVNSPGSPITIAPEQKDACSMRLSSRTARFALLLVITTACTAEDAGVRPVRADIAHPEESLVLERGTTCARCEIELKELAVLGNAEDSLPIGDGSFLVVLGGSQCIVAPTDRDGEALAFDRCTGGPRPFGRRGSGPGELSSIRGLAPWLGDSVLFFGYGRIEILSAATGRGRSLRFDAAVQGYNIAALPRDSVVVVNNNSPSGVELVAIRADEGQGEVFDLLGAGSGQGDPRARAAVLGSSPRSRRFWSGATFYRHQLARRTVEGATELSIARLPSWFPIYDSLTLAREGSAARSRPRPTLRAVHEAADGVLWAAFGVASSNWQPDSIAESTRRTRGGEIPSGGRRGPEHFDGVIEAYDAESGSLMVSIRTDQLWAGFANDSLIYTRRQAGDGAHQLVVYRLRLRKGEGPPSPANGAQGTRTP